jgi:uncharacterized membrane protein required for colicin V production
MASLAALGYRQGAIRVAFSFVGILLGAALAVPLGKLIKPLLMAVGVKNPVLLWALAPFIVFVLISVVFKVAALTAHHKVEMHHKYHAGDLRLALWERMHRRLGLCLGIFNGVIYFVLLSFVIYALSYWTVQVATSDESPKTLKILNRLGQDLQATGFSKVARAVSGLSPAYYAAADVAGLVYNNPLSEARLARYPAFLGLAERPELKDLGNDQSFNDSRAKQEPISSVMSLPRVQAVIGNPELLKTIWATAAPDLQDLRTFLVTGKSAKYGAETILGRWDFNPSATLGAIRRAKPGISASEMLKVKKSVGNFLKATVLAMTDHQAVLKDSPPLKLGVAGSPQTFQGEWKGEDGKYEITLAGGGTEKPLEATVEADRMSLKAEGGEFVFTRED